MRRLNSFITLSAAAAFLLLLCRTRIEGSVHGYAGEIFLAIGNAFVVHGGSEGIYSSAPEFNESLPGVSFIRFENIIFRRPLELSNFSSGSVHTIVFEVDDRETIGGSAYGGQRAVCCTADLSKLGVCTEGQIIHRPSTNNPGWPQVFGASFDVDKTDCSAAKILSDLQKLECITCTSFIVIQDSKRWLLMGKLSGKILLVTYLVGWLLLWISMGLCLLLLWCLVSFGFYSMPDSGESSSIAKLYHTCDYIGDV